MLRFLRIFCSISFSGIPPTLLILSAAFREALVHPWQMTRYRRHQVYDRLQDWQTGRYGEPVHHKLSVWLVLPHPDGKGNGRLIVINW